MMRRCAALLLLGIPCAAAIARAQSAAGDHQQLALLAGASPYDLSKTGTGVIFDVGMTVRAARRVLVVEWGAGYFLFTSPTGRRTYWVFPEVTLQAEAGRGRVRPYAGGGIGAGIEGVAGPDRWAFTMNALGGVRIRVGGVWGARLETRVRSVRPFSGHTLDFSAGVTREVF